MVTVTSAFRTVAKVIGPFLLGFGTIFQAKAGLTDHWSTSPAITIHVVESGADSGDPANTDEGVDEPGRSAAA